MSFGDKMAYYGLVILTFGGAYFVKVVIAKAINDTQTNR